MSAPSCSFSNCAVSKHLGNVKASLSEKHGRFVDWTSTHSVDVKSRFAAKETDCTVTKVAKFAATLFLSLILFIPAVIGVAFESVKGLLCKKQPTVVVEPSAAELP